MRISLGLLPSYVSVLSIIPGLAAYRLSSRLFLQCSASFSAHLPQHYSCRRQQVEAQRPLADLVTATLLQLTTATIPPRPIMTSPAIATALPPLVPEEGDDDVLAGWSATICSLFRSGHHKWGFLVYRTVYDDEEAWVRFMDVLTRSTDMALRQMGKDARLQPYLEWKVVEDRAVFDGASKGYCPRALPGLGCYTVG